MALNELLRLVSDSETPDTTLIGVTQVGALTGAQSRLNLNVHVDDRANAALHIDCTVEASVDEETWSPVSGFSWDGNTIDRNGHLSNGPQIDFDSPLISEQHVRITSTANLPMRYTMILSEIV